MSNSNSVQDSASPTWGSESFRSWILLAAWYLVMVEVQNLQGFWQSTGWRGGSIRILWIKYCMTGKYRMTGKCSNNCVFQHCFEARSRTTACKRMMSRCLRARQLYSFCRFKHWISYGDSTWLRILECALMVRGNAVRHTVRLSPYVVYLRKYTPYAYISYITYVFQDWF